MMAAWNTPEPAPLELTREMMIRPVAADWRHASRLLDHPTGCRCSTCRLIADMRRVIRDQEGPR